MSDNTQYCKLHILAFGLAAGLTWGVSLFVMATIAHYFKIGMPFIHLLQNFYAPYHGDIIGGLAGGIVAFIDVFLAGVVVSWLYNCFVCCCNKKNSA